VSSALPIYSAKYSRGWRPSDLGGKAGRRDGGESWRDPLMLAPIVTTSAANLWSAGAAPSPDVVNGEEIEADIVIVGTGAGGSVGAWALRESGARVLVLEMGDWLPREAANWDADEVYLKRRYKSEENWVDELTGATFHPGLHDFVGGNTKVFGAAFPRFRVSDFEAVEHIDGTSPSWPIDYEDLEPYYEIAEEVFRVHGDESDDPSAPPRRRPLPFPRLEHEPFIDDVVTAMRKAGASPSYIPMGVDRRVGGKCIRCQTCDGYPCQIDAKSDAEVVALRPALESGGIRLLRNTRVERILTSTDGTEVIGLECVHRGRPLRVRTPRVVLACGAVRTAILMQRSTSPAHPNGVGNVHDLVGRHYMQHVNTALTAVDPRRKNTVTFQKTVQVNDWYAAAPDGSGYPWGNVQALGKLQWAHLKAARPWVPKAVLRQFASRSVEWWVMSEDLPRREHQVRIRPDGRIGVTWQATNMSTHKQLIAAFADLMRSSGFPLVFHETLGIDTNSHQCGTARMGIDPSVGVVDPNGAVHGVRGLWAADSSVFVSSAAVNPALTIAANSLRTMDVGGVLK
jgi:choline dehydrogenase-like flavoprotein